MRSLILTLLLILASAAGEYAVVTASGSTIEPLSERFVKDIFLKKRTFYKETELLAVNLHPASPVRMAFEAKVLGMDRDAINEYWIVNHYKGIKPPLVQRSENGVREFLKNRPDSIGYLPKSALDESLKVLYEF
jgi:hypothetical protein